MPRTRRQLLEFDEGAVPVTGLIGPVGAQGQPFVGYTQLLGALEALIAARDDPTLQPNRPAGAETS
jgi:hypothetical protein